MTPATGPKWRRSFAGGLGVWITWRTASSAITFITECDKDGNKREKSNG